MDVLRAQASRWEKQRAESRERERKKIDEVSRRELLFPPLSVMSCQPGSHPPAGPSVGLGGWGGSDVVHHGVASAPLAV